MADEEEIQAFLLTPLVRYGAGTAEFTGYPSTVVPSNVLNLFANLYGVVPYGMVPL
jgi:hypothetical protein